MKYYIGIGTEFVKENCKEYRTLNGAIKAADKEKNATIWDESGNVIKTELETGKANEQPEQEDQREANEQQEQEDQREANEQQEQEEQQETNEKQEQKENEIIIPQGKMKVTIICEGTLNLRRSATWENNNICGRASRGQSYYVKAIHIVNGKKMIETIDNLYLSGQSEYVQFEQL